MKPRRTKNLNFLPCPLCGKQPRVRVGNNGIVMCDGSLLHPHIGLSVEISENCPVKPNLSNLMFGWNVVADKEHPHIWDI